MEALVQQEDEAWQVLDDEFVAGSCREKLLDLADEDHEISRAAFRRLGRSKRSGAPLLDRRLVGRAERLGHEQNFAERPALHRHLPGRLDEVVTDYSPMAFAGPAGSPGSSVRPHARDSASGSAGGAVSRLLRHCPKGFLRRLTRREIPAFDRLKSSFRTPCRCRHRSGWRSHQLAQSCQFVGPFVGEQEGSCELPESGIRLTRY